MLEDAKTITRFFIVTSMGRSAGHLAMHMGKSAGVQLTLIQEEFQGVDLTFKRLCDVIETSIIKRVSTEKNHGVIVLAEGIVERLPKDDLQRMFGDSIKLDDHGHILFSELDFGKAVRDEIRRRTELRKLPVTFTDKNLGYEVRCAPPNAYDGEYARDLGYGAVKFLREGGSDAMITFEGERMKPVPFEQIVGNGGKVNIRPVDVKSEGYQCALKYMIRLEQKDITDENRLQKLAQVAKMSAEEFKNEFGYLVL
jgi:6-phosphofructokinase 1